MMPFDYLDALSSQDPDAVFAVCGQQQVTYVEAREAANRVASRLRASGLEPGDRIATIMKNSVELAILYFGAFKVGVVPAPISHRLTPREWHEICDDAEARLVFVDRAFASRVEPFRRELSTVRDCVVCGDPLRGWLNLEDWIGDRALEDCRVVLADEHEALQIYTSGTTGKPRGAVLTNRGIAACIQQLNQVMRFHPTDRFLMVMPLFHAAGMIVMLHAVAGGASLFIQSDFVPVQVVETLDTSGVSVAMMAPTMIRNCLADVADISERHFKDLRLIIYGGSPMPEATLREAMKVFGCDFAQRYGSTETLCLTWLQPRDHELALRGNPGLLGSAGRPLPGVEVRIIDGDQQELPVLEYGEIAAAGPQLMKGYWKLDNDRSIEIDGRRFLRTGDCGIRDADNYLYIRDRSDDVIISGGENIYPREIEEAIESHPEIEQAAVVGVSDPKWGEAVKAVVVKHADSSLSAESLMAYCRKHMAGFKTPRSVDFVDDLPRNAAGKLLRHRLWEYYRSKTKSPDDGK